MADGDEQDTLPNRDSAYDGHENEENRDNVVIEGLRSPLTTEKRQRRTIMTAVVIAGALLVLLWPTISALGGALPSIQPFARATATPNVQTQSSLSVISATIVVSNGSYTTACRVTPQTISSLGMPEMQADASGGEAWALLLSSPSIQANSAVSIVWKATGAGAFRVVATGPGAIDLPPTSGPDPHDGSNWNRPGDEWGTTFTFPQPGCWQLSVTRGASLSADLWLMVSA